MSWTRFMDMHSGGGCKEPPYEYIYIEADEADARRVFWAKFGHNPDRVTCTCCGEDYSVSEEDSLEQASAYDRGCRFASCGKDGRYLEHGEPLPEGWSISKFDSSTYKTKLTLAEYEALDNVLVIRTDQISSDDRRVDPPTQGYVWA